MVSDFDLQRDSFSLPVLRGFTDRLLLYLCYYYDELILKDRNIGIYLDQCSFVTFLDLAFCDPSALKFSLHRLLEVTRKDRWKHAQSRRVSMATRSKDDTRLSQQLSLQICSNAENIVKHIKKLHKQDYIKLES